MTITKLKPVDAIVVGTGISGSIVAMELANAGNPPAQTIGMLACWVADGIKDVYLKQQRAMV